MATIFHQHLLLRSVLLGLLIAVDAFVFHKYIYPIVAQRIIIDGQVCTCPEGQVIGGRSTLVSITPDSIRPRLDFGEVFLVNGPSQPQDFMGAGKYWLEAKVIGKKQTSNYGNWYPMLRVTAYHPYSGLNSGLALAFLVFQLPFLFYFFRKKKG